MSAVASEPLALFKVTLVWNPGDVEEGDYCTRVWAKGPEAAITAVAEEMADSYFGPKDAWPAGADDYHAQRVPWVANIVGAAQPYAAQPIESVVLSDVMELLAGPSGEMTPEAHAVMQAIADFLARQRKRA